MSTIKLHDAFLLDDVRRTDDGYLTAFARVARTGIQTYKGYELGRPDLDTVRVYRPPEEVFHADAMHSAAHRPVTMKHPPVPVTAKNWRKYSRGQTGGEVVRDGEYLRVPMVLMDQSLVDAYEKKGVKELSLGYSTDIKWRTGVVDAGQPDAGQTYDAVQTAIRVNHLAVVPEARGGKNLRIGDTLGSSALSRLIRELRDMDGDLDDEDEDSDYVGDSTDLYDTTFTEEQRKKLAESGAAMPGGGFPIRNAEDLHHAMEAIGRAKDPSAARAHIRARAKELGLESELGPSFKDAAIKDAWSDEARAAALEARKRASYHNKMAEKHIGKQFFNSPNKENANKHKAAGNLHLLAANRYEESANHFIEGNMRSGESMWARGKEATLRANAATSNLGMATRASDSSPHGVDYVACPECGANVPPNAVKCDCGHNMNTNDGVDYMTKIVIDGVPVNVADEQTAAIIDRAVTSLQRQLADAKKDYDKIKNEGEDKDKEIGDAKKTIAAKDGEIAVLKKQVDDAKVTPAKLDVMVKDRLAVIDAASPLLDKTFSFDGKSVEDIRRAAVDAHLGDAAKGMDDATVSGAFAALTADSAAQRARGGSAPIRDALMRPGARVVTDSRQAAYDEKIKRQSEAWRKPVTA